jgi:hypothetical protein
LGVYTSLTVWLTWPLAASLGSKLPCPARLVCYFDVLYSAWAVSWLSHALTTAPWHLGDANIYFPDPQALYYGPAAFGAAVYAFPAYALTGNAAVAINVALLAGAILTACTLHWVAWRWTGSTAAGFVAAWTFLMNRWVLWGFVASTPHLAVLQYLPLIVFLAAGPLSTGRRALMLLALIVVQCLTDPVYVAPAVMATLGCLALARLARPAWRQSGWRLLGVLAALPICLAVPLLGYVQVRVRNPGLAQQTPWQDTIAQAWPTDLTAIFSHRSLVPALGIGPLLLGFIVAGAVAGALRRWRGAGSGLGRAWAHGALWLAVGAFISLTPTVVVWFPWGTSMDVHLPQYLLAQHTTLYETIRVPSRLAVGGMIALCLLAALALVELTATSRRWQRVGSGARGAIALGLAALLYSSASGMDALPASYPLQDAPVSDTELLRHLRARQGPVLELPSWDPAIGKPGLRANAVAMYRATEHWRPLLNGYSSYWPAGYLERTLLTTRLPGPDALHRLVCETGVRSILVNLLPLPPDRRWMWQRLRDIPVPGLTLVWNSHLQLLFDVTIAPPGAPGAPPCPPSRGT